jgi:nitroreductase
MNFQNLLQHRYSVREYKPDLIDQNILNQVLTAAQFAPTAANRQPFKLIVIHTQGKKDEIQKIYDREWFSDAPIVICACGFPGQGWVRADGKSYLDVDIAIVMDHVSLAAADLGLGTCWVASFDVDAAREYLQIPTHAEPIVIMSLGYPAGLPGEKERKSLDELIAFDSWMEYPGS